MSSPRLLKNSILKTAALLLLLAACASGQAVLHPDPSERVYCGYHGWFQAEGDGSGSGKVHFGPGKRLAPGTCSFDLWPDLSEFSPVYDLTGLSPEKFPTVLADWKEIVASGQLQQPSAQLHQGRPLVALWGWASGTARLHSRNGGTCSPEFRPQAAPSWWACPPFAANSKGTPVQTPHSTN